MQIDLSSICEYRTGKVSVSSLDKTNYISTENILPNKGGITAAASLPKISQTQAYYKDDVLVSNIRPYFKKIWRASFDGGCSNDVLVFHAKDGINPDFLYYVLSDDSFFEYAMATSKGTKMPRGDRISIMQYHAPSFSIEKQIIIARILRCLDDKIALNTQINDNLQQQAMALFQARYVDFEPFDGIIPNNWKQYRLGDFLPVVTGKKNANVSSSAGQYPFFSCSQGISWTDSYSFDGNAILVAGNGDFNVKFYNGKFEAYQRTYVLIPYNPRFTAWLFYAVKYNLRKITILARGSVIKFITKGNLEDFSFYAPSNLDDERTIDQFAMINDLIEVNRKESITLVLLRDALLPCLMSGELDVSGLEI